MSMQLDVATSEATKTQLLDVIKHAVDNHPRTLQTQIGPSEIGNTCDRRIGYKLAGVPAVNTSADGWLPTIGTATHEWLAAAANAANFREGHLRYLVEHPIELPDGSGGKITGNLDLYDIDTGNVIDWKIVGKTTLDKARTQGPSEQYRTQLNIYALGLYLTGEYEPKTITVAYLPRNQKLRDAIIHSEPVDLELAGQAVERLANIRLATNLMGPAAIPNLQATESHCTFCPYYRYNADDLTVACPGSKQADTVTSLLG